METYRLAFKNMSYSAQLREIQQEFREMKGTSPSFINFGKYKDEYLN